MTLDIITMCTCQTVEWKNRESANRNNDKMKLLFLKKNDLSPNNTHTHTHSPQRDKILFK